jgi:lipoprotein-anchoring transpeptidase ErfK/SrfK
MPTFRLTFMFFGLSLAALVLAREASPSPGAAAAASVKVVGSGTLTQPVVVVRIRPDVAARRITTLSQFRADFHPRVVLALGQRLEPGTDEAAWYRIALSGRPNGRTGWVRAAQVDLDQVDRRIVIYRESRRFEFWVGGRVVRAGKVAVGAPGMETPLGLFYVTAKFRPTWSVLGAFAFETSAYSKLSEWPGGGVVGLHGTNSPQLLGQAVSHGCVRLHDRDALFLRKRVPVGTPIKIVRA